MNLETKRNAIMNAIASGTIPNLLENETWVRGFLNGTGGVSPTTTSDNEYTSDFIDVSNITQLLWTITCPSFPFSKWIKFCLYDDTKRFISPRREANIGGSEKTNQVGIDTSNASYIRLSIAIKSYGSLDVGLYDISADYEEEVTVTNQSE